MPLVKFRYIGQGARNAWTLLRPDLEQASRHEVLVAHHSILHNVHVGVLGLRIQLACDLPTMLGHAQDLAAQPKVIAHAREGNPIAGGVRAHGRNAHFAAIAQICSGCNRDARRTIIEEEDMLELRLRTSATAQHTGLRRQWFYLGRWRFLLLLLLLLGDEGDDLPFCVVGVVFLLASCDAACGGRFQVAAATQHPIHMMIAIAVSSQRSALRAEEEGLALEIGVMPANQVQARHVDAHALRASAFIEIAMGEQVARRPRGISLVSAKQSRRR